MPADFLVSGQDFLIGGGTMGARIHAHDWATTPLGPLETWPQSLRTALSMVLNAQFPACIAWGDDLILLYNDAYQPILGGRPEALGQPFPEVWSELWPILGPILRRALDGEAGYQENMLVTMQRSGAPEHAWWSYSCSPIRDEAGGIGGVLCLLYETTAEVKARAVLQLEKERLRGIFEQTAAGIAQGDTTGLITMVNRRFCNIVGYPEAELVGMRMQDITHPDDLSGNLPLFRQAVEDGTSFVIEKRYIRKDGSHVWVSNSVSPLRDAAGRVQQVVSITVDITERKRAEEGEQRLAAIIESSEDAILSMDLAATIMSWNKGAEQLYGYRAEEMIGRSVTILLPKDRQDEEMGILERISRGEHVHHYETVRQRKDGSLVEISLTVSPIRDAQGKVIGASKIARDITERRRAERLQGILMHELNHRIKNTLAMVQAIARQTFRDGEGDSSARQTFEARLLALSNAHDLLTRESWDGAGLCAIIDDVLAPYPRERFEISGPDLRLTTRVALALTLALHELATNAAKYGALSVAEGRVAIAWTVSPGDPPQLTFRWQECGGPRVSPPTRTGFGSRLIERSLAADLAGEVKITYDPAGVRCDVSANLTDETRIDVNDGS